MPPRNARARFLAKVDRQPSGCWKWTAALRGDGYPTFWLDGRQVGAHRVSYELFVGPIEDGLVIDHLCGNRSCVNPEHIEAVTDAENLRRRSLPSGSDNHNGAKTHCPQGHAYTADNTIRRRYDRARVCRTCRKAYRREYRARLAGKEATNAAA